MAIARLHFDEAGYEEWLDAHGDGFVFNSFGGNIGRFNVLHRATCRHLRRSSDEGRRTVVPKLCSQAVGALEAEADALRGDRGWHRCMTCL